MKDEPLLYINSHWTTSIVHIAKNKQPLCNKKYKKEALAIYPSALEYWVDEVSCNQCVKLYFK